MAELCENGGHHMTENCICMERLEELEEANSRLQVLVSELLLKNQELRIQLSTSEGRVREFQLP